MSAATIAQDRAAEADQRAARPLAAGSVLRGRFELLEAIGGGGMSVVYRAVDRIRVLARAREPEVAVKVMAAEGDLQAEIVELAHREARYLHELLHPNIVRVFDSDCDGIHHFIVLELLRGRTLTKILRGSPDRRLSANLVIRIVGEAAAGLAHAHAKGVVHGDLKPSNLFMTLDGDVKILDFGAARAMDQSPADAWNRQTLSDVSSLTPIYASLETLAGEAPTESDDVFSLAVLVYVMLTGRHPFDGKTASEALAARMRAETRPPALSRSRWRALQRGLAIERRNRAATITEFVESFTRAPLLDRLLG